MDSNKQTEFGIGPSHTQSKGNWVLTWYTLMWVYTYYAIIIKGGILKWIWPTFYVNDLLLLGEDCSKIKDVKHQLGKLYQMKDLGPTSSYLGIRIPRDWTKWIIWIDQQAYIENTLKRFKLHDANNMNTPLPAGIHLEKSEDPATTETKTYHQQIIRTLIYATIGTRFDIVFAATWLSWFNNNPMEQHIKYAKYALRYFQGTKELKIKYNRSSDDRLIGYSDSD